MSSSFTRTLDHTQRRRTPLDERSARRRDLYLTTHNTHNRQISLPPPPPPVGFEPTILAGEPPQTYPLVRAATETGVTSRISATNPNTCVVMYCILHSSSEIWNFRIFKLTACFNWMLKNEFWSYN
jgi:hypothetical protein